MIQFRDSKVQMDDLLDKMAASIQLDTTRRERMETSYNGVKDWIEKDEGFFKGVFFHIYPQGSVRIGTAIKPLSSDEFDLDIVIHLVSNRENITPDQLYKELQRRLLANGTYEKMLELKNRCVRLNYAGDFHMDILPGIQENRYDENKIVIPDKELGQWVSSNPKGYSEWFINKANSIKQSILEKALMAEKLPIDDYKDKKPLQRAVQLIKRYRDEYFKDKEYATSSIILTTIAGHSYNGEDSIFDTIDGIIFRIQTQITQVPASGRIKVLNPVNPDEDFTDKWDGEPSYYSAFIAFTKHLYKEWQILKNENGVITEARIMKGLFGEALYDSSVKLQAEQIEKARRSNTLGLEKRSGLLTTAGLLGSATVKANTFFGE